MNKYLINESPLTFQPTLAAFLGLSEAIVLQQVQYWTSNPKAGVWKEGFKWVYNSYQKWQEENFPFWSVDGVKKIFLRLEEMGILVSKQIAENPWDKTKYYRIDYEKLDEILAPSGSKSTLDGVPSTQSTITETTTEITNTASGEIQPSAVPDTYPVEWQIAGGKEEVVMPDEKDNQMKDTANLLAMGAGVKENWYFNLAYAFMKTRGIIIPMSKIKGNRKALKEMVEMNVQAIHVIEATKQLMAKNYTLADLYSVVKTAVALANPAPDTYEGAIDGV